MSLFPDRHRLRGVALGTVALLTAGLLAACGDDSSADPGADDAGATGPWSYTDGLGQEIELEETPQTVVAYGDAAAALINFGVDVVGLFHYTDPESDSTFESIDLSDVEILGSSYGEIDLEQLALLDPDLIVTTTYEGEEPSLMYGFKDETQMKKVREIAPVIGIVQSGTAKDVIEQNEELVASLGIDTGAGSEVAEDRAAFEEASAELGRAAENGVSVLPLYAEDAGLYLSIAKDDPALNYYRELGVDFVETGGEDDYYWEIVSWENADKYDPDLILYSVRDSYTPEQLMDQPTFAAMDAAEAGQVHPWKFKSMDYEAQAEYMSELAGVLAETEKLD